MRTYKQRLDELKAAHKEFSLRYYDTPAGCEAAEASTVRFHAAYDAFYNPNGDPRP